MNDFVQFEDQKENMEYHFKSRALLGEPQTPGMIRLLLKSGIVKDEQSAAKVLIGGAIVMIVVAIGLTAFTYKPTKIDYSTIPTEKLYSLPSEVRQGIYENR